MKIISTDGTAKSIKVLDDNGKPIGNITSILIHRIRPRKTITATITVMDVELDLECEDTSKSESADAKNR